MVNGKKVKKSNGKAKSKATNGERKKRRYTRLTKGQMRAVTASLKNWPAATLAAKWKCSVSNINRIRSEARA